jgi:hypothetical protein
MGAKRSEESGLQVCLLFVGTEDLEGKPDQRQGETVLDRIHQSMILFAAGRGEALHSSPVWLLKNLEQVHLRLALFALALEIAEELEAALEQFAAIAEDLKR